MLRERPGLSETHFANQNTTTHDSNQRAMVVHDHNTQSIDAKQLGEPGDYRHSVLPESLQEWLPQEERLPQVRLLQSPWRRGLTESMPKPTCLSVAASTSCRSMPPWTDQGMITRNWTLTRETDGRRYNMVIHVTRETCRDKVGSDHTKKNAN